MVKKSVIGKRGHPLAVRLSFALEQVGEPEVLEKIRDFLGSGKVYHYKTRKNLWKYILRDKRGHGMLLNYLQHFPLALSPRRQAAACFFALLRLARSMLSEKASGRRKEFDIKIVTIAASLYKYNHLPKQAAQPFTIYNRASKNQFLKWFVGFSEGAGFWEKDGVFFIERADPQLLQYIKEHLLLGTIFKKGSKFRFSAT